MFKAWDDRLDRRVAIKRIPPGEERDALGEERLRREARAAAKLNHPAIVQVYDIFQDGDSACIVMEFVEGESVDRVLRRGPLEAAKAAPIAHQVALGLAEAHSKGVLHRDLKSENVMLTVDGQAKILDFGLAKPVRSEGLDNALTGKGQVVGTSRSMAPEYVGGNEVDERSDLFSLGVFFYELTTGVSPFRAHNSLATLKQVMLHHPPRIDEVNRAIPRELADLVQRLLAKEPAARPSSSRAVARELASIADLASGSGEVIDSATEVVPRELLPQQARHRGAKHQPAVLRLERPQEAGLPTATAVLPRERLVWSIVLAVGAAALAFLVVGLVRDRGFDFEAEDHIVLGDFVNTTGDDVLDDSLGTAFRLGLEQSHFARVLPEGQIRESLTRMRRDPGEPIERALGLEICQREGAKAFVVGSIVRVGEPYSLSAEVVDCRTESSIFTVPPVQAAGRDEILTALEKVARKVRTNLGESLAVVQETSRPLEKVTTPDLEALKRYSLGVARLLEARYEEASVLLEEAIERDPEFAMAYTKLGVVEVTQERSAGARSHFEAALRSVDRLTEFETLYVEGWMANLAGSPDEMLEAWNRMRSLFPSEFEGHHNIGVVRFYFQNDFRAAEEAFGTAIELGDSRLRSRAHRHYGYSLLALGRFEEALASFQRGWELDESPISLGLADGWTASGQYARSLAFLERGKASSNEEVRRESERRLLLYLTDRGRLGDALELARRTARQPEIDERRRLARELDILALLSASGRNDLVTERLPDLIAPALELARTAEFGISPVPLLVLLGKSAARHGALEQAIVLREAVRGRQETMAFPLWEAYRAVLDAEIVALEGRPAEALEVLAAVEEPEVFQVHESLARLAAAAGDKDRAIAEWAWIVERRGQAFAECLDLCRVRLPNLLAWVQASYELGRLRLDQGESKSAQVSFRTFLDHWGEVELPEVDLARQALGRDSSSSGDEPLGAGR